MTELYDIRDGLTLMAKRRRVALIIYIALGLCVAASALFIVFGFTIWMAVLFAVLWVAWSFSALTYFLFFRKIWNARYHFLAKVEQFERRREEGEISFLGEKTLTVERMILREIRINEAILYVEEDKSSLFIVGKKVRVEAVDGVIVAYEEL